MNQSTSVSDNITASNDRRATSAEREASSKTVTQDERTGAKRPLLEQYRRIRNFSRQLVETLEPEDCVVQSMPDCSPIRWHLAHTTWFFETFVLKELLGGYRPQVSEYAYLFNSYYNALGDQFPRARRGLLSRPTLREVWLYRQTIDELILESLEKGRLREPQRAAELIVLGLQHEQQHQELMLTDIKHAFSCNPLFPAFRHDRFESSWSAGCSTPKALEYTADAGGLVEIGNPSSDDFAYDNEQPQHTTFVNPFEIANRTVTCGEYLQFMEDGGYLRPELWLSEGWERATAEQWSAPLYWFQRGGAWHEFTLAGLQTLDVTRPVCHISYFEADAYARWAGARLPTEFEWERTATAYVSGRREQMPLRVFADQLIENEMTVHPQAVTDARADGDDILGNVWEWTSSSYSPYPGYQPGAGAIGEYNGKFMCNQYVLRGGSCATSSDHIRITYRNFFPSHARWQFSGLRCARD